MMSCTEAHGLLHGLLDGELDPGKTREVEAHVNSCPRCAAELSQFREMRAAMRDERMTFAAPAALRSRIEAALAPPPVARAAAPSRRWLLQGFALGSALSAAAAVGIVAVVTHTAQDDHLLGDVVSAHLRSLQSSRLTDVAAVDRQALLPWFSGKVAVAPPVIDLAAKGFTLVGGRLDFLDGKAGRGNGCTGAALTSSTCSLRLQAPPAMWPQRRNRCRGSVCNDGAMRECASSPSAILAPTNSGNFTRSLKRRCARARS